MTTKDITLLSILTAILVASQLTFSMVMGINLVFPLMIIYTYNLGFKKTMIIMIAFNIIEFFIWGYFLNNIVLWTWTFTVLISGAYFVKKSTRGNEFFAAFYTFIYFILFGLMASIQEAILTNVDFYVYWIRGIMTDVLGAIPGFITTLLLLVPITKVIQSFVGSRTEGFVK